MTQYAMVALMWAAALYRIVLSLRSDATTWRTAFTACTVGLALATTTEVFGDQTIDVWFGAWNLSLLLTRLLLTGAAVAASIAGPSLPSLNKRPASDWTSDMHVLPIRLQPVAYVASHRDPGAAISVTSRKVAETSSSWKCGCR